MVELAALFQRNIRVILLQRIAQASYYLISEFCAYSRKRFTSTATISSESANSTQAEVICGDDRCGDVLETPLEDAPAGKA